MALAVPLSRFTPRIGGGSAFYVRRLAHMKPLFAILLFVTSGFSCLIVSLIVTWFVWEAQVPDRVFRCNDVGISLAFWTSADIHESAGDTILPGHTWDGFRRLNEAYKIAFYTLWIVGSLALFRLLYSASTKDT